MSGGVNFVRRLFCLGILGSGSRGPLISHVDGIFLCHGGAHGINRSFHPFSNVSLLPPNAPVPNLLKCFTSLIVLYVYLFLNSTTKISLIVLLNILKSGSCVHVNIF